MINDEKLRKRFCKDMGVPIQVYQDPYFSERIKLLNPYYNSISKLEDFEQTLKTYENEEDYFNEYSEIKDNAINYLKEKLIEFQSVDMNEHFPIINQSFTPSDIFKENNHNEHFISIDMTEANFSCLKHFDDDIFPGINNYREFISQFTDEEHFIKSKYIRQVIFGNQNPKRQTRYQKYIMDNLLTSLLTIVDKELIVSFANDEIVIKSEDKKLIKNIRNVVDDFQKKENIRIRFETFKLEKVNKGYKKLHDNGNVEFKSLSPMEIIFAIREHEGQDIQENDKVFIYENQLAKLL